MSDHLHKSTSTHFLHFFKVFFLEQFSLTKTLLCMHDTLYAKYCIQRMAFYST
jgi:hypothetical protein